MVNHFHIIPPSRLHTNRTVSVSPICNKHVVSSEINEHLDNDCSSTGPDDARSRTTTQQSDKASSFFTSRTSAGTAAQRTSADVAPISRQHRPSRDSCLVSGSVDDASTLKPPKRSSAQASSRPTKRSKNDSFMQAAVPLAERLRPTSLSEFVGQPHLTGPGSLLMNAFSRGTFGNLVLWGPPGCGKTTLARLIAKHVNAAYKELSATIVGINEVRAVFDEAKGLLSLTGR